MSHLCHMLHVNCHLSPVTNATDPPPSYSSIMNSRLVAQSQKTEKFPNAKKIIITAKPQK